MIEQVGRVQANGNVPSLVDPEFLLKVCVEVPAAGPVDRAQAQGAQLAGFGILQNDVAVRIGDRRVRAEGPQDGGHAGA